MPAVVRDRGLITLEWLLIVGAIAGLAASTVLIVQNVVDDTSNVPVDPIVRLIQADVAAAEVSAEAQSAYDTDASAYLPSVDDGFKTRCEGIGTTFDDVVDGTPAWQTPDPNNKAACNVTPEQNLGG